LLSLADLFATYYLPDQSEVDFASIRLHHTGADFICRALHARAFTVGLDIYFADGAFAPYARSGLWLLAHEVAHVVQQSARGRNASGPVTVMAARTSEERAANAAADAFIAGRPFILSVPSRIRPPVLQRYMAWEHGVLGDLAADDVRAATAGGAARSRGGDMPEQILAYRGLLNKLGKDTRRTEEERLRSQHLGCETLQLPGSGLVVTLGELNALPDYMGHPSEIETASAAFLEPLIQSVRSWSIAELGKSAGQRRPHRRLPGALRYTMLGGLAETAEVTAIDRLGKRCGLVPSRRYSSVLARNASHFAPFSWHRWHSFHLMSRQLIQQSATASEKDRDILRRRARIYAGYADHFLQDSFAAGHLINKTLVMQWYIEWLAESGTSYPDADVLAGVTVARQPFLHGPDHYDRESELGRIDGKLPPPWDPQDMADLPARDDRVAVSGLVADGDDAYVAYLKMLSSGSVQLSAKVVHEYLNRRSLVVSTAPDGPRFRLYGDRTLLVSGEGAWRAAQAAAASRRAISELLHHGETAISSWEIFDSFPSHVEQDGRLIKLDEWHRTGLRDLCFRELFGRWSTRALRRVVSSAFNQLGTPTDDEHQGLRDGADTAHAG
jgi:hypothetical protein